MAMIATPSPALYVVPPLHRTVRAELAPDPLRDQLAAVVERSAVAMLDPDIIEAQAEDMRLIERHRVHHAGLLIVALVLSALQRSTDTQGRWLDAQRTYERIGGARSGKTSFRNNVRKLVPLMNRMLRRRLKKLVERTGDTELRGRLLHFADVLVPDGCAFKVAAALSGVYAGTGTDAELKLHAVHSVRAGGAVSVKSSAGSMHDSDGFWPEHWEAGALYLWDLGFENKARFIDAVHAGAHVLQRLKSSSNPIVVASYGPTGHGRAVVDDLGRALRLEEACSFGVLHATHVLDLDVRIDDTQGRSVVARVVCVPFGGEDRYYLTTLPRAIFTPHDVAELYRVRWEVERMFRGWRGALRLDEVVRLSHPKSIVAAITASLLAATLAQDITRELNALEQRVAATPP
jgi:putative transposase